MLEQFGKLNEAIDHFQQALDLEPDFPEVHNNLGNALVLSGQISGAIEQYQAAATETQLSGSRAGAGNSL